MRAQFSDGEEDDGEEDDGEEDGELEGGEEEEDADGCRNCFSCLKAIPSGALVCLRAEPHNGAAIDLSAQHVNLFMRRTFFKIQRLTFLDHFMVPTFTIV